LAGLKRGGHDPIKVYAAYKTATEHKGQPTVIWSRRSRGTASRRGGRGEEHHPPAQEAGRPAGGRGQRPAQASRRSGPSSPPAEFRDRFDLPATDEQLAEIPFLRLATAARAAVLPARRQALGGTQRSGTTSSCRVNRRSGRRSRGR
jgi:pyruvate dehydrogenase E1 component